MTSRIDSIPHETRTAAEPRQNKLYTVRLAHIEQINPSVRLLRLALPLETSSNQDTLASQSQEQFSFLPGQWLDVHVPGVTQAGGFTITSTPADSRPLPNPDSEIIQNETKEVTSPQHETGPFLADSEGRYPYVELAVQESPSNPPAAWLWRPQNEIIGTDLQIRVGGSFVWPPASLQIDQIRRVYFVAGGVGIKETIWNLWRGFISPLISILSHLSESGPGTAAAPLAGREHEPVHPLDIRFLYSTRIPSTSSFDLAHLDQILFLSRLRNIIQRINTSSAQSRMISMELDLFLTNLPVSLPISQVSDKLKIVGKTTDKVEEDCSRSAVMRVHARRINTDDLDVEEKQRDDSVYYICGPPAMTDELVQYLEPIVGKEQVLYEKWW